MQKTNSGAVESHAYDQMMGILTVTFKSGQTYNYHGIEPGTYAKLQQSDSFMTGMRDFVMGKHNHTKV